jgi:putative FmdB family regulatory protein
MTYEYVCQDCGHQWEAEQSIKDKALKECVSCGKSTAKRLVSGGTGFLLKGGGWYADGYGSPGAAKSTSSEEKSGAASSSSKVEGKDGKAADAKPASDAKSSESKAADSKAGAASSTTPAASTGTPSSAKAS